MYLIDFISAECYPAAKVGGLADVVGSLPKYINEKKDHKCRVIMPFYGINWFKEQSFEVLYTAHLDLAGKKQAYEIRAIDSSSLGFDLIAVHLPGLFDRNGIYAIDNIFFKDEPERNLAFQRAYLDFTLNAEIKPNIIHCHDHHTGLIPYMISRATVYKEISNIPTVFTIHNGQYHGAFGWEKESLLPVSPQEHKGLLDWDKGINSLSSALRCAWKITTVSPTYMKELRNSAGTFQNLLIDEKNKSVGILNGIDYDTWNPETDEYLHFNLKTSVDIFKQKNKKFLVDKFNLVRGRPLFSFIGRFAQEKGVDTLIESLDRLLATKIKINVLILGTGDNQLEAKFKDLNRKYDKGFHAELAYNEGLAHNIYAGSDFLMMPSRVEPCGLNQMYSMRYGTLPIVHGVGGLEDTVIDFTNKNGNGLKFRGLSVKTLSDNIIRGHELYKNKDQFVKTRDCALRSDYSWTASTNNYLKLYYGLNKID